MQTTVTPINDINKFAGTIPTGEYLVEYLVGTDPVEQGSVLYGFDEIGMYVSGPGQRHAFIKFEE